MTENRLRRGRGNVMRIRVNGMESPDMPGAELAGQGPWLRIQHVADTHAVAGAAVVLQRA